MNFTFVRFLIVGLINTLVGLTIMYVLYHLANQSYWLSTFIGNSVGAVVSFILNRSFTFKSNGSIQKSIIKFLLVILCCYFISYHLGTLLVDWSVKEMDYAISFQTDLAILLSTAIYTITNYICQKQFVFRVEESKKQLN
ncbi:GtrA family protein [Gottfriedia solisilvae]|uniref:GtrA family protein n=1 Tax=Gottfriedia solisilvae TaxID=1516104 RepID=UPI003D2EA492